MTRAKKTFVAILSFALWISPVDLAKADTINAGDNLLELIFYPAPRRLDWTTPGSLIRTMVHNWFFEYVDSPAERAKSWFPWENFPHKMSHVNVRLTCTSGEEFVGGMSQEWLLKDILRTLNGSDSFDRFISTFPGFLIPKKDILAWLSVLRPRDQARSLVMRVNTPTCHRLAQFIKEYQTRGYDKTYSGFIQDPLKGEGAGCAAFAMTFLRVGGLWFDQFDKRWKRILNISESLMSRPGKPAKFTLLNIIAGDDGAWAGSQPQIKLNIFDPQLMYDWVEDVWRGKVSPPFPVYRARIDGSLAVFADLRGHASPTQPIWPASQIETPPKLPRQ